MSLKRLVSLLLLALFILSCSTKKQIVYLQDVDDYDNAPFNNPIYTIQPNDILKIDIQTPDYTSADGPFTKESDLQLGFNLEAQKLEGFLVSSNYIIKHNVLGEMNVKDKTTYDLESQITKTLIETDALKDPMVSVKIINAKFTIQGEVRSPGTYNLIQDRLTILQALGTAGDLTINGLRENILIFRQQNGKQIVGRIDITSAEIINSPFYFIKQNDYIYVEPNGPRTKSAGYLNNFGSVLTAVSVLLSTYLIIRTNF